MRKLKSQMDGQSARGDEETEELDGWTDARDRGQDEMRKLKSQMDGQSARDRGQEEMRKLKSQMDGQSVRDRV